MNIASLSEGMIMLQPTLLQAEHEMCFNFINLTTNQETV